MPLFDKLPLLGVGRSMLYRYVLAVLMSTVTEKQKVSFTFDSNAAASGYFTLRIGSGGGKTATIPYDAVRIHELLFQVFEHFDSAVVGKIVDAT